MLGEVSVGSGEGDGFFVRWLVGEVVAEQRCGQVDEDD